MCEDGAEKEGGREGGGYSLVYPYYNVVKFYWIPFFTIESLANYCCILKLCTSTDDFLS